MASDAEVLSYVKRIRNSAKREYAVNYALYLMGGEVGEEPERGPISFMAGQGVRMQVQALFEQAER